MKNKLLISAVFLLSAASSFAQDIPQQPASRQASEIWRMRREADRVQLENARKISEFGRSVVNNTPSVTVSTVSGEFTGKAKKFLKTADILQSRYKSFLQSANTGIVTLLPEKACSAFESKPKLKFDKLIERCPFIFVPGGGRFFSFRQNDYVNYPLADIGFKDNLIFSLGTLNQGILVALDDSKIEDVSPNSKGMDFLFNYNPASTLEVAAKESQQFENGLKAADLTYKNVVNFEKNKTYALRVVAYNPYSTVPELFGEKEIKSYILPNDKREDIIIVFSVVEKTADGNIVLLWKELKRTKSPEILITVK